MTVYEFVSQLQDALDRAAVRGARSKEVIITFIAPSSGFCGPTIRPKFQGPVPELREPGKLAPARYGLTRNHVERLLEAFDVTLPPEYA